MDYQERRAKLFIENSLTRKKEKFVTQTPGKILWYNCGPTVYDSSHMGHARSYISLDIIRRILVGYFGYDIKYVMNITDIDDKIIRKARQMHLFETFKSQVNSGHLDSDAFEEKIQEAVIFYETKLAKEGDPDKKAMMTRLLEECKTNQKLSKDQTLESHKEILFTYLDNKSGSTVSDNEIFVNVPRKYEAEFFDDMFNLNVMDPGKLTRVSEYVPQIVDYISHIIVNGYAYESNQSVYFDTVKFSTSPKHKYAKLEPERVGDEEALAEGEGVLTFGGDGVADKKHPNDFALWKKSKPGEPSWKSPWGEGRPGWHIECSVMASDTLGNTLDIHSGGIDLKFPHHDNEMAQSEAYYDTGSNWVNYFLHTGHLTISGCKMSKSLKNFITIKDALKRHSWRQLRIAFLLHSWNTTLNYGDETMRDALSFERRLNRFFWLVKWTVMNMHLDNQISFRENELLKRFDEIKQTVETSLCDNFNTKKSLDCIDSLFCHTRDYLKDNLNPNKNILNDVTQYIADVMKNFGAWEKDNKAMETAPKMNINETIQPLIQEIDKFCKEIKQLALDTEETKMLEKCDQLDEKLSLLGIKLEHGENSATIKELNCDNYNLKVEKIKQIFNENGLPSASREEIIIPVITVIAGFRQEMRQIGLERIAIGKEATSIMEKCDSLREKLIALGIELEDSTICDKIFTTFSIMDRESLLEEMKEKKNQLEVKRLEKERKKKELDEARKAKDAQRSIPPTELFINQLDKYSAFDEKGLPTMDAEGKPISKSALKKLVKLYEQQEKKYEEFLKSVKENA